MSDDEVDELVAGKIIRSLDRLRNQGIAPEGNL